MADRYADKQIKVLKFICKNNFREDAVTSSLLKITGDALEKILEEFQQSNLLKVQQKDLLNSSDEYREYDDILIYYVVTSKDGLSNLLAKLKKNHPRHSKPIIREKTLEKISKHFSNIASKEEIVELLIECGVPKSLIEGQFVQWKIIFSVLNYYALSTKKEDFQFFKKIIESFIHPLMFDGNKKEAQGMIDMLNSLLEYDGFVIKDGHLQSQVKTKSKNKRVGKPFFGEIKVEISLGKLCSYNDGTIKYAGEIIGMRNQIKELCRFFMNNPKKLLTIEDIKKEIINSGKRGLTPKITIAKYVSELSTLLRTYFEKEVIFNQKEVGWYMDITKS